MMEAMFHFAKMLARFENLMDAARRRSIWTLSLAALCLMTMVWQVTRLKVELDLYGKDATGFATTRDFREQRHRFKDSNSALILFSKGPSRFTVREACQIREWLRNERQLNPEVTAISTPFDIRQATREGERTWYPLFFSLDCESPKAQSDLVDFSKLLETPWKNSLTDRDGRDFAVEVLFRNTIGGSRFGTFDPEPVKNIHLKAEKELKPAIVGLEIYLGGASAFESHLKDAMSRDMWLQGLVFIFIFIAFRIFFGTWRAGVLFLGTLIATLLLVYGAMAIFGAPLDLLTSNLVLMTTLAGLEDFLFVSMMMRVGFTKDVALRRMIAPCFFTTLTTVIGFLSLNTSSVEVIGRFGIWAAWGALAEWIMMFFILPSFCTRFRRFENWVVAERAVSINWLRWLSSLKVPRVAAVLSVLFFIGGVAGFRFLNLNDSPTRNFPVDHLTSRTHRYLHESRGWESVVSLVFESPNIREEQTRIENVLHELKTDASVVAATSPFELEDFVAKKVSPDSQQMVKSELQLTEGYSRLFSGRDQARGTLFLESSDLATLQRVKDKLQALCPDDFCRISGHSAVYLEYSRTIVPTLLESFALSLLLVGIILYLLATALGVRERLAVVYSAIWGPIATLGIIALFQIPVSLMTSIFAATIVGLTGDNGIQFLFASKTGGLRDGIREQGTASVFLSLLLAISSLVFMAETVKPMKILGILFFIGFIMNLSGDLWLLKGTLRAHDSDDQDQSIK